MLHSILCLYNWSEKSDIFEIFTQLTFPNGSRQRKICIVCLTILENWLTIIDNVSLFFEFYQYYAMSPVVPRTN